MKIQIYYGADGFQLNVLPSEYQQYFLVILDD